MDNTVYWKFTYTHILEPDWITRGPGGHMLELVAMAATYAHY